MNEERPLGTVDFANVAYTGLREFDIEDRPLRKLYDLVEVELTRPT